MAARLVLVQERRVASGGLPAGGSAANVIAWVSRSFSVSPRVVFAVDDDRPAEPAGLLCMETGRSLLVFKFAFVSVDGGMLVVGHSVLVRERSPDAGAGAGGGAGRQHGCARADHGGGDPQRPPSRLVAFVLPW